MYVNLMKMHKNEYKIGKRSNRSKNLLSRRNYVLFTLNEVFDIFRII